MINKLNIIKNIFKNKLYFLILSGGIFIALVLPLSAYKYMLPSFYNQMITNTLEDAKKVGKHIARHQNHDVSSTVFYTALDKLKDDFKIVKIRLFDEKGKIVFSTKTDEIGNINDNKYYFEKVAKGEMYYKVVRKGSKSLEGNEITLDVAEIYVPIMKEGEFAGSSEIYYDITDKKESFNLLMNKVNKMYNVFSFLIIVLTFTVVYILSKNNLKELNIEYELKEKVDQKTKQLLGINQTLENRIKEEVAKNREKESQLFQQSKLASMGEMIGNIAHQWRQPLSAITSTASAVKLNNHLGILENKEIDEKMDAIVLKANFLSTTIENFRNFFKTDNETKIFNLIETVEKVKSIVHSNYKTKNIKIIDDFQSQKIEINSLEGELSQVILNILNNSYDNFVEKNIQDPLVKISINENDSKIKIKIIDNGGGIPQEIIGKIFEPYFTTKHKSQGTGIGLYMCTEIVNKHLNGKLYVLNEEFGFDNKKYFGAAFTVEFDKRS